MKDLDNRKNRLLDSQKSLFGKLKKLNQLFKIHFISLVLFFLFSLSNIIFWMVLLIIGQAKPELFQRYGIFGLVVTFILIIVLFLLLIALALQIYYYSFFIVRGDRSLKQVQGDKEEEKIHYNGIVPYITNFYAFFNRYSKEKTNYSQLVFSFLLVNFFLGFYIFFIATRFIDPSITILSVKICGPILFLLMVIFWLMDIIISIKIRIKIVKWEKLFTKLEEWAQELEKNFIGNANHKDREDAL
jgi:hypothetical protein